MLKIIHKMLSRISQVLPIMFFWCSFYVCTLLLLDYYQFYHMGRHTQKARPVQGVSLQK